MRNVIERTFSRLKDFRRIATRYDKLAQNFLAAVFLVSTVCYCYESTRGRCWQLIYAEKLPTRTDAMSREWHLKRDRRLRRQLSHAATVDRIANLCNLSPVSTRDRFNDN